MCTTLSIASFTWLMAFSAASEMISPKTWSLVVTTNPMGWMGAVVPGGRTGRWTPRWPQWSRKDRTSAKLPNSAL